MICFTFQKNFLTSLVLLDLIFLVRLADLFKLPKISNEIDDVNLKIVNGQIVNHTAIPFMAYLQVSLPDNMITYCGAVILNQNYIVTAAHCVVDKKANMIYSASNVKVRLAVDMRNNDPNFNKNLYDVWAVYVHPDYRINSYNNDLALLRLSNSIVLRDGISLACLDYSERQYNYYYYSGYGGTSIRYVNNNQETVTSEKAGNELKFAYGKEERDAEFCNNYGIKYVCINSYYTDSGDSGCYGDSGGPIVNPNHQVLGVYAALAGNRVNSDLIALCVGKSYYTRLSRFQNYIDSYVGRGNYCFVS